MVQLTVIQIFHLPFMQPLKSEESSMYQNLPGPIAHLTLCSATAFTLDLATYSTNRFN